MVRYSDSAECSDFIAWSSGCYLVVVESKVERLKSIQGVRFQLKKSQISNFQPQTKIIPSRSNMLLELKNISVGYDKPLVSGFSAEVKKGELVLLLGRNGVGKSTLLGVLKNIQSPLKGEVSLLGKLIQSYSVQELSRKIAIVNTTRPHLSGWTVESLLENTIRTAGVVSPEFTNKEMKDVGILSKALDMCQIQGLKSKLCDQLSDGEFQKVMIARAICQRTPLIIMDEPTSFLDVIYREQVLEIFEILKTSFNISVVLSSHNFAPLLNKASQTWVINHEKVTKLMGEVTEANVLELMK